MAATLTNEMIHQLRAVSALTLTPPDEPDLHRKMLRQVGKLMRVETAALVLREGLQPDLQVLPGLDEELENRLQATLKLPTGRKILERLAHCKIPLVIRSENATGAQQGGPEQAFTLIGAPLLIGQRNLGVLLIATRRPQRFREEELLLLQLIAERITSAVGLTQLYKQEQQARVQAETNSRLRDEFLAKISHEIRTPLNSILGWVSLLRTGRLSDEQAKHALATIERSARLQSQVLNDLLDLSTLFNGQPSLELRPVQPEAVITTVVESLRPAAAARGIELVASFASTGGDSAGFDAASGAVLADPGRLRQIFVNLLSNALKFAPEKGRVWVELQRSATQVEISVRDNGIGIQPEFLPFVFERFSQGDSSSTRRFGGLGLGLAIVRRLVEQHGGSISAESAGAQQGARFVVRLPLYTEPGLNEARQPWLPQAAEKASMAQDLSGLHVLVVDDDFDSRQLVSTILSHCQADARTAAGANEALELMEEWQPDVLISDLTMPGVDGYELIQQVRAREPLSDHKTLAIALTAHARAEDRLRVLASGFQTHVPKPVAPAELLAVVASLTGRVVQPANANGAN